MDAAELAEAPHDTAQVEEGEDEPEVQGKKHPPAEESEE